MSLKRHLEDRRTPLRRWLDGRSIPIAEARMELIGALRAATPLLPDSPNGPVPWSLLGNAIGVGVTWHHTIELSPAVASGAGHIGRVTRDPATGEFTEGPDWSEDLVTAWKGGPTGVARHAGALAAIGGILERLTRTAYRRGEDPLVDAVRNARSFDEALAALPEWFTADVAAMSLCGAESFGTLSEPLIIGPDFAGSHLVGGADADLIAGSTLWDVKANRDAALRQRDLHQIHRIRPVGGA